MRLRGSHFAIAASLFFFLAGQPFVPLLGVEADEALFGMAFFPPRYAAGIRIGHSTFPLMIMTYLGTLKAWIYRPILRIFRPGVWTLREPALVAGAVSIWLFYLLLRRIAGERAAVIGAVLLATDSLYLLTTCFDWGPVALQHLLLTAAMYLFVRSFQERSAGPLAAAGCLLGLALWDKAVAEWMISGIGIAALALFWPQIRSLFTWRRAAILTAAFLLGSLPLWTYNARFDWATFRGNFRRDFSDFRGKALMLQATFGGEALFSYLAVEEPRMAPPHQPSGPLQRISARIADLTGNPRHYLVLYSLIAAILLAPFAAGGRRSILFALIAMLVAWGQMAITTGAGGSVHHTILMWPLPYLIVAVSLATVSKRVGRAGLPMVYTAVAVLAVGGLLLTNTYYNKMFRNGGSESWNDAILPLSTYLQTLPATYVYCMDWGMLDPLRLLSRGKVPVASSDDRFSKPELTNEDREAVARILADGTNLYVARTANFQFFPDNPKFLQRAAKSGYRPHMLAVIDDSFGRPVFEVYRLEPASQ